MPVTYSEFWFTPSGGDTAPVLLTVYWNPWTGSFTNLQSDFRRAGVRLGDFVRIGNSLRRIRKIKRRVLFLTKSIGIGDPPSRGTETIRVGGAWTGPSRG